MKRLAWCLVALMVPAFASAQEDADAFMNVAITPPSYGGCDAADTAGLEDGPCTGLASDGQAGQAFVFVVASHLGGYADGVGAVQFGIEHSLTGGWTVCTGGSEIQEAGWPASGTGNAITFSGGCYNPLGENAVIGFLSLNDGSAGAIAMTPDPRTGLAQFTNCAAAIFEIPTGNLGSDSDIGDGTLPLCTSDPTPIEDSSWSELKNLF